MKKLTALLLLSVIPIVSCASREVTDKYSGATAQRLTAHSIHDMIKSLPETDFALLREKPVFLACYFLNDSQLLAYARKRMELELLDKYQCRLVQDPSIAALKLHVFFTSLGTDADLFGLQTPALAIPGIGLSSIDLVTLEMFHGITELYYYIIDDQDRIIAKSEPLKTTVRNDSLGLPIITIPINTVD